MKLEAYGWLVLLGLMAGDCHGLGRLFYSPDQRALLERPPPMAKMQKKTSAKQSGQTFATRLDGIVRGQRQAWVWFDGELKKSGSPPLTPMPVDETQVTLRWRGKRLKLKAGQKVIANENGKVRIQEAFGP